MNHEHIHEREIQLFVVERESCDAEIVDHISRCPVCAMKVEEYKTLFMAVHQQEKPVFDFPLADLVVAQISQPQPKDRFDKLLVYIIGAAILVFAATIIYLFRDVDLKPDLEISSVSIALIIITIVGMTAFLVTDMYRKYQKQMNSITP
jgi:hypothetical protein